MLMDRLATWAPVLLLGSLAALTYWLNAQIAPQVVRPDGSHRHDPDIYVENVHAVSFGSDGKPLQLLSAARGEHFPDDDTTMFSKPDLVLKDPKQPTFAVTADSARIAGDRSSVWFTGNVHATRDADTGAVKGSNESRPLTLTTEYLHVLPQQKLAETDRAVTFEDGRGVVHAVGMKLDAENRSVKFLSQVQGSIAPQALPR